MICLIILLSDLAPVFSPKITQAMATEAGPVALKVYLRKRDHASAFQGSSWNVVQKGRNRKRQSGKHRDLIKTLLLAANAIEQFASKVVVPYKRSCVTSAR